MAEDFLMLMAVLDDESQRIMSGWYEKLQAEGFVGKQTPNLPFHISLAGFSLDKESEAVSEMNELTKRFKAVPVHISHIGLFAGGSVLYAAPDMNPADLLELRHAIKTEKYEQYPWTPHVTVLIDEPVIVQGAMPFFVESFQPFMGKITKLQLCAFWPTREIATVNLEE